VKKYFSLLALLFSALLLSACTTSSKQEALDLTSLEKLELLQTMQTPDVNLLYIYADIDIVEADVDFDIDLDGTVKSYTNLKDDASFYNYSEVDFEVKSSLINGSGKGSLYALINKAYLNVDASVAFNGSSNKLQSKEWMEYPESIPLEDIVNPFGQLNWSDFQNLDPENMLSNVEKMLDFVTVYQDGNETSFDVSITKTKLLALQNEIDDPVFIEVVNSLKSSSYVSFSITFKNNIFRKVELSTDFEVEYEGIQIDANARIVIDFSPTAPKLPSEFELSTYTKVDMFSVFDSIISTPRY
jgi:hypothetical protein